MNASADVSDRLGQLESRVKELEAVQDLLLRLMSTTRPLSRVLDQYGATETRELALYKILDDFTERANGPERDRPSLSYFKMQIASLFPELRNDVQFVPLLIDTLKVERPAYRKLYAYMRDQGWTSG